MYFVRKLKKKYYLINLKNLNYLKLNKITFNIKYILYKY